LDLEDLAQHRGSLLGALPGRPQPSQKMFESRLLQAIERLDPTRLTLVEAEASKIGERMVPPTLWRLMIKAPRITLDVPLKARARYLAGVYAETASDLDALEALLARLPGRHGAKAVAAWRAMAEAGDLETLAGSLTEARPGGTGGSEGGRSGGGGRTDRRDGQLKATGSPAGLPLGRRPHRPDSDRHRRNAGERGGRRGN
jgi:hypothetical protein